MDNMRFYKLGQEVPNNAKKPIQAGRLKGMTDINPMWRIKQLTEMFGPCGIGWWYEIENKRIVEDATTKQSAAFRDILLFYVDPATGETSHGIPGTGGSAFVAQERNGPYLSDECFKMALTDAISVAAKALGIGADVYWAGGGSKYDKEKDEPTPPAPPNAPPTPPAPLQFICADCGEVLQPYKDDEGRTVAIRKHATASEEQFGKCLCLSCIQKMAAGK